MDIFATNFHFEFGLNHYPNGGQYGPLYHPHLSVFIMKKGNASIDVDGERFQVGAGECGLVYNRNFYQVNYDGGNDTVLWCGSGMSDPAITTQMETWLKALPRSLPKPSSLLAHLINIGVRLGNGRDVYLQQKRNTLGATACNEYFHLADLHEDDPLPGAVSRAKRYIDRHFASECDLESIADFAAMSPQHLTKIFKQHMGCTPIRYLWTLRSEKSIHLLNHSGLRIHEIAMQCGFKNPYHFCNHIKKYYGFSPKEIRNRRHTPKPEVEHQVYSE